MRVRRAFVPPTLAVILLAGCGQAEANDNAVKFTWPTVGISPGATSHPTVPVGSPGPSTSGKPAASPTTKPASTTRPPGDTTAPVMQRATADAAKVTIAEGCNPKIATSTTVRIYVADPNTDERSLKLTVSYIVGQATVAGGSVSHVSGNEFRTTFGPVAHDSRFGYSSDVTAVVTAVDPAGNSSGQVSLRNLFQFGDCQNG